MANLPPYSTPRWVKVMGLITLGLVLLLGILHLSGVGGNHGPGRHMPQGSRPTSSVLVAFPASGHGPSHNPPGIEHSGHQP